jgi:hypothetical protein
MATETVEAESAEYPKSWLWAEDGNLISGRFLRFDEGSTRDYGSKPIVVLDVDGQERSIWLTTSVLFNRFRDELERRASKRLEVGERIVIERSAEQVESENGRKYWPFKILFPDRPTKSEVELFDLDPGRVKNEKPADDGDGDGDGDIPF